MRDYRVLIVDDDVVDRRLYCKLLGQPGREPCHVRHAEDGASGLMALRADTFDCLLLDFNLPMMNGLEFLTAAAVDGELPCAVVLITGQGNEAIAVAAMKQGVHDYLVKDQVSAGNLRRAVEQAVSKFELQRRLSGTLRDLTAANLALEQEAATRKLVEIELRAAKEAAEKASVAKTRFVAMVTHELRTPLNGILGYAQLLRLESRLSARQDKQVAAMMLAGRHLLEMIEGVLDFVSIESGRMELRVEPVSVRDLTEACIVFISPMATERALGLRIVSAHDAPRLFITDPARLRQVLLNLLGNAVKYTSHGSVELRVLAGAAPDALRIEVADTGRGIDEACRHRMFQDFERLEAAGSVEGAGLGLAIAARIVARMGGEIKYMPNSRPVPAAPGSPGFSCDPANPGSNPGPGPGSVFWFELPAAAPTLQPGPDAARRGYPASGLRVLLVDDIKINLDIIASFLNTAGHVVITADSGEQSVRLAADQHFDLILMDMRMPEMDGLEAARRIRALPGGHGKVPILALTAYSSLDQVAQCLNGGMDGHVAKPVNYETLMCAIDDALARVSPVRVGLSATVADRAVSQRG